MKVSNIENTDQEILLNYAFDPVIQLLKCNGYYLGREKSVCRKWGLIVLTITYKLVVLYNVLRYGSIFIGETNFSGSLTSSMAVFAFYCYVAYVTVALTFSLPRNFWIFLDLLRAYISDYGAGQYLKRMRWRIRKFVIISTTVYLTFVITFTVGVNNAFPTVRRHMVPFNNKTGTNQILFQILYVFCMTIVGSQLVSTVVVFVSMTLILWQEFRILSRKFKDEIDFIESNFSQFCKRHERLCIITAQSNSIVTHIVFATYTFGIPILCFLTYGLVKGSLAFDEFMFCSGNLLTIVLLMMLITGLACALNDRAHEPLQHMFNSNWSTFDEITLHKMSLVVGRFSSEKIGYSVYGLFTIDKSTILMICGTIVTYVVVVLQFQTDTGQGCVHTCPPLTSLNLTQLCQ